MADPFLRLAPAEQADIIRAISARAGRPALLFEKDVWICWVLQSLFDMPGRKRMVFKGGTSLSKVFNAINRFSEDIDLTVDYRELDPGVDPFADGLTNRRRDQIREHLEQRLAEYIRMTVVPHLTDVLAQQYGGSNPTVNIGGEKGEKLIVSIGSQFNGDDGYVRDGVLLEFGGRNVIDPHQQHEVRTYLMDHVNELSFPIATVDVLAAERTFWEKATLLHGACNDEDLVAKGVGRLSRHWYDLSRLADLDIGTRAIADRALLADVVRAKKVVFRSARARYDDCVAGGIRLVPDTTVLNALREDYEAMIAAGMFEGDPPNFQDVINRLRALETAINEPPAPNP
jgi:hypothetical protein